MPTRLPVLLHRWKSAKASAGASAKAAATSSSRQDIERDVKAGKGKARLPSCRPVSREGLRPVNDDGPKIVHVGPGRACFDEVAQPCEEPGGIVVREKMGRIEAERSGPDQRALVYRGAGRVIRGACATVGAVSIPGQCGDAGRALQRQGQRQGIFLVRAAAALAADGYG